MGSSRDWAAKGAALLGARAVLAAGFERIHRSNLVNMGVLPLRLPRDVTPMSLRLDVGDLIVIDADPATLAPRAASLSRYAAERARSTPSRRLRRSRPHWKFRSSDPVDCCR